MFLSLKYEKNDQKQTFSSWNYSVENNEEVILRCVAWWKFAEVSEEHSASNFKYLAAQ
jgi:hypothetical protein